MVLYETIISFYIESSDDLGIIISPALAIGAEGT